MGESKRRKPKEPNSFTGKTTIIPYDVVLDALERKDNAHFQSKNGMLAGNVFLDFNRRRLKDHKYICTSCGLKFHGHNMHMTPEVFVVLETQINSVAQEDISVSIICRQCCRERDMQEMVKELVTTLVGECEPIASHNETIN